MTRLRTQSACMKSVEAETLARRRIDPTNADRLARIMWQHGEPEVPPEPEPEPDPETPLALSLAGLLIGGLVFAMLVWAWVQPAVDIGGVR